jgi:hypothetical protein
MAAFHRIRTKALDIPLENASSLLDTIHLTFVMGCPRSGTTFLLRCLGGLPRTQSYAGILIPDRLCHVIASADATPSLVEDILHSCRAVLWKTFVTSILSRRYHLRRAVREPRAALPAARVLLGRTPVSLQDFGMVYKEPFLAMAADTFARHFSRARFVHLIRDGRDCADSMERTYGAALSDDVLDARRSRWREVGSEIGVGREVAGMIVPWWVSAGDSQRFLDASRYERYLWLWRECVTRARASEEVANERYLEIRYEELCANPGGEGERLLDFLGLEGSRRFWRNLGHARSSSIGVGRRVASGEVWEPVTSLLHDLGYA